MPKLICVIILLISCASCKKNHTHSTDAPPSITFIAGAQKVLYSGYSNNTVCGGVVFYRSPYNDISSLYTIAACKDDSDNIAIVLQGPHLLSQDSINKIKLVGIAYTANGIYYASNNSSTNGNSTMTIKISTSNLFSGTFMGTLYLQTGEELNINDGSFNNLTLQ